MVRFLQQQGHAIYGFDFAGLPAEEGLHVNYQQLDVTDANSVANFKGDFDYVFYFAGLTGTDVSFLNYEHFISVNEIGMLHFLKQIGTFAKRPKIIFPSTRLVYKGESNTPLTEDAEKEFKTIYASSKYNGELYLKMYRNLYGLDYSIFRICIPYGNLFDSDQSYGTLSFFLNKAKNHQDITLYGTGSLKRTFTHVTDICRQMAAVSFLPDSSGECYNIGGETFSLYEVAEAIGRIYDVAVSLAPWPEAALKLESGDTIFSDKKIGSLFQPLVTQKLQLWIQQK